MKKLTGFILAFLIIFNLLGVSAAADALEITSVKVSDEAVTIEGITSGGASVTASGDGNSVSAAAGTNGVFSPTLPYSSNDVFDVTVTKGAASQTVTIDGSITENIEISYDKATSVAKIYGNFDNIEAATTYVIYSVHGGKSVDDIYTVSNQTEILSGLTQSKTLKNGSFSYEYEIVNAADTERIYVVCKDAVNEYVLDTNVSTDYIRSNKSKLMTLPQEYEAYSAESTRENFFDVVSQLPDEMPIMQRVVPVADAAVYVSLSGSDTSGDGSIDNPYATIAKAVSTQDKKLDTTVYLREGTYFVNDIVEISGFSGSLTIMPYNNEKVTITNGISIKGTDFTKVTSSNDRIKPEMIGKVWEYDLTKSGLTSVDLEYDSIPALSDGYDSYNLARWPDGGTVGMKEYTAEDNEFGVIDAGPYLTASGAPDITENRYVGKYGRNGFEFVLDNLHPFTWDSATDIFMCGSFYKEYNNGLFVEVEEFDADKQSVKAKNTISTVPSGARYNEENSFYYFNVPEELNMEGDWCLDSENLKLYVYPCNDMESSIFNLSVAENDKLFSITDSSDVTISGIEFSNTSAVPVYAQDSQSITLQDCTFRELRGNGVVFDGCKYSGVIYSDFKDINLNSVTMTNEESMYNLTPDYNFVQNSTFYNTKSVQIGGTGVIVSHNMFSNMPGAGVNLTNARECVIEYNEFLRTPTESDDMGAIYLNGWYRNLAHHIRYNYIHECSMDREAPVAIYLDEIVSYNYVYSNILENGARIHMHSGSENSVYNNIIINNEGVVAINDSENHIRYFEDDWETKMINKTGWFRYLYERSSDPVAVFDKYDQAAYQSRYPHFMEISELMKWRADEFRASGLPVQNKSIYGGRPAAYNSSKTVTYSNGDEVNLDIYLRAPRDNYYANNAFINSTNALKITATGQLTAEVSDNAEVANPFTGNAYGDASAYDEIRETIPGFETIPFDKIGINDELTIEDVSITYPQNGIEFSTDSVVFKWTTDLAASQFVLEISDSSDFSDKLYSYDCYRDTMELKNVLTDGTYYVRVTANPEGASTVKQSAVSDTVQFKVTETSTNEGDVAYITACAVDEEASQVSFNYYNTNSDSGAYTIFVASYLNKNLIKVGEADLQGFDTLGRLSAEISPDADSVALFNWIDTTLTPLCGKKLITIKPLE